MDIFIRSRMVNTVKQKFIASNTSGGLEKFYVIQNLGPAKVAVNFAGGSGPELIINVGPGDCLEVFCMWAEVQVAGGESFNGAVIQWQPVS